MGIEKKGVGKNPCIYLVQSVVNFNGCCIGSDIRCLPKIHESSIIQTELYSPPLCPAVGKKQTCVQCLQMLDDRSQREQRREIVTCSISYFQILNSVFQHVLWNFCDLFTCSAIVSIFLYCLFPLTSIVVPPFSFEREEKDDEGDGRQSLNYAFQHCNEVGIIPKKGLYYREIPQSPLGNFWQN